MEKEDFVHSMDLIKSKWLKIAQLVTNRYAQIVNYVREKMPNTKHYFVCVVCCKSHIEASICSNVLFDLWASNPICIMEHWREKMAHPW